MPDTPPTASPSSSPSAAPHGSPHHPYSSILRQRARHLVELAAGLERSLVFTLPETVGRVASCIAWDDDRTLLCDELLERNLHQLHRAADDLRSTAFRFRQHADQLDLHHRRVAA